MNEDFSKINKDYYKVVNVVFTKHIYKIMFDIHNQPYFEWAWPMRGNRDARNTKLRCSYHKDHWIKLKITKPLSNFYND